MKNKPIPRSTTLLGTMLLLMSTSSYAVTPSAPQYIPGAVYRAGAQVQNVGKIFECKPWPYTGWCSQAAYAPGSSIYWQSAWTFITNVPTGDPTNSPPVINGTPKTRLEADRNYHFAPTARDADAGDTLSFSIQNKPGWANFNSNTGTLTGTPTRASITNNIIISVSDGKASANLTSFSLTVVAAQAPVISLNGNNPTRLPVGTTFSDPGATANDNVDGILTNNIIVSGSVNHQIAGSYTLTYSATDRAGHTGTATRIVLIESNPTPQNSPPTITGTPATLLEADGGYHFAPVANDVDTGDTLSFSIQNKPDWASFNVNTGTLTGTPTKTSTTLNVTISVSDGNATTHLAPFALTVVAAQAPVITLNGSRSMTLKSGAVFNDPGASATDNVDGNLTAKIIVSGSVNTQVTDTYTLTYRATDKAGHTGTEVRTVLVENDTNKPSKIPQYVAGTRYNSGDQVQNFGKVYECKPWPYTGWCQQSAYEPGQAAHWRSAWILIGDVPGGSGKPEVIPAYVIGTNYMSGDKVSNLGHIYRCKGWPTTPWCKLEAYAPGDSANWQEAWEYIGADTVDENSANGQIAITLPAQPETSISNPNITVNGTSYSAEWGTRTLLTTMPPGDYKVSAAISDNYIPQFTQHNNNYFSADIDLIKGQVTEIVIAYVAISDYAMFINNTTCSQCHSSNTLDSEARAEKWLFNKTRSNLVFTISKMRRGTACIGKCSEVIADYLRDTVWEAYRENIVNRNNNNGQLPDNKGKRVLRLLTRYEYLNTINDVLGIELPESEFSVYVPGRHLLFPTIHDRTVTDTLLAEHLNKGAVAIEKQIDIQYFTQCESDDIACIIETVGKQLFHRPLTSIESITYVDMGTNEGLPMALASMTLSPNFLYRTEMGNINSNGYYQLTQYEIATALAYDYTGHGPDDLLLDLADRGDLNSPTVLEIQARRLMHTDLGKAHLSKFFEPLIEISDAKLELKDDVMAPGLIQDMRTEFQLLLAEVIVNEPAGLSELYNPGYTFLNTDLANHYALDSSNLTSSLSKVATTANQGGLLHMGIFHTSNSSADSTHLIRRSRVVRENLLCRNLGTPVGMIPESIVIPELGSSKEFWTAVNGPDSGVCWDCHQYMNDVGFALDSFDIQGKYRTTETVQGTGSQSGVEAEFDLQTEGYFISDNADDIFFTDLRDLSLIIGSSDKNTECISTRYLQFVRGYKGEPSDSTYLTDVYNNNGKTIDLMVNQVLLPSFINKQ